MKGLMQSRKWTKVVDRGKDLDSTTELKRLLLKCSLCGCVWKKHFKKIELHGKTTWKPSKEMHFCQPKPRLEDLRKDWQWLIKQIGTECVDWLEKMMWSRCVSSAWLKLGRPKVMLFIVMSAGTGYYSMKRRTNNAISQRLLKQVDVQKH